jgi:hypothetical protein
MIRIKGMARKKCERCRRERAYRSNHENSYFEGGNNLKGSTMLVAELLSAPQKKVPTFPFFR